jgi:predicted metalloprotease with PDZ domain
MVNFQAVEIVESDFDRATGVWYRQMEQGGNANYDELADCHLPFLGNQDIFTFDYKGIPHHIAMVGKAEYDREKIKADFYRIVDECTRLFGDNPNKEFTFIVHNVGSGGGGLEHMNSTSVITARSNYENDKGYKGFLSLIAHEYFHSMDCEKGPAAGARTVRL